MDMFWATKEAAVDSPASQNEVRSFRSYGYRILCVLDGDRLRQNDGRREQSPGTELTIRPISQLCGAASCLKRVFISRHPSQTRHLPKISLLLQSDNVAASAKRFCHHNAL
jgi:hypothetical protein